MAGTAEGGAGVRDKESEPREHWWVGQSVRGHGRCGGAEEKVACLRKQHGADNLNRENNG